jgi:hypothetical protein
MNINVICYFNQSDKLNIEDDEHNLNSLLNNYYDDNGEENSLDIFHIDSNYYEIEQNQYNSIGK